MEGLNINYKGTVKIKQYKKGKLIRTKTLKNAGTSRLFYILCMYLCGRASESTWLPTFLDIAYQDGTNYVSILNNYPRLSITPPTGWTPNATASCITSYQTTITSSYINKPTGTPSSVLYFLLRDNIDNEVQENRYNILAYVSTEDWFADTWNINSDDVYIISWDLEIGNSVAEIAAETQKVQTMQAQTIKAKATRTRKVTTNAK